MAIYVNKEKAKKYLATTEEGKYFYAVDGSVLKNIYDLLDFFEKCSSETYSKHANREKNDFASWAIGVFKNERLKENLLSARTENEAALYTKRNINMLERNAKR